MGVLGVALLFFALQTAEIGRINTLRGDETYYIQAAYTMIRSGDWLVPRYESGRLRLEKPIGTYWAVALSMHFLGFDLAHARLPSVLFTLATLPFVYGLSRVLLEDGRAALLAVLAHVSTRIVYSAADQARTDAILAFFAVAAMYYFARLIFSQGHERRNAIFAYGATAGAVLTKGGAALIFVLLPLAAFLIVSRRRLLPARRRALFSPWGLGAFLLLILPWYVYVLALHGGQFWQSFYGDQIEAQVADDGRLFFISGLSDYVRLFFKNTLPWNVLVILAACTGFPLVRDAVRERRTQWLFLLLWLIAAIVVFSFGTTTRGRYLLPVIPVVSLFTGLILSRSWEAAGFRRFLVWGLFAFTAIAALIAIGFLGMLVGVFTPTAPPIAGLWAALLLAAGLAFCAFARRASWLPPVGLSAMMMGTMACVNALFSPSAPLEPLSQLARDFIAAQPPHVQVASAIDRSKLPGTILLLYTGRRPTSVFGGDHLQDRVQFVREYLERPGEKLIIVDDRLYRNLPGDVLARVKIVASRTGVERFGLEQRVLGKYAERFHARLGRRMTLYLLGSD